jgi:protein N-terminal methyltransferase
LVALDCGAGVGRVSKEFLLHHFHEVDLVEPSAHLLEAARKDLCGGGSSSKTTTKPAFPPSHKAVGFFQQGLESFDPAPGRYDVIWVQWAMLYLTDEDAISFLNRCAAALKPGGVIFIKENVCAQGFIVDSEDASVTRSHAYNVELFTKRAGLKLAHTALQKDFPKQLFKVRMYALKPV